MNAFYVNPVYGYRAWMLHRARGRLVALTRDEVWPTGKPLLSRHLGFAGMSTHVPCAPGQPCESCGIYAFENYGGVQDHQWSGGGGSFGGNGGWSMHYDHVRGIVAGWGRVTLCTKGWRAGKAYPLALLDWQTPPESYGSDGTNWHATMHVIAQCYDVPVVPTVDDLVEVAGDAGAVSLSAWREQGAT